MCLKDIQRYDAHHDPVTLNYMAAGCKYAKLLVLSGTVRSEDEDDYEYEVSVLSTHTKHVGLQTLCACSVWKTRTGTRPRPPI